MYSLKTASRNFRNLDSQVLEWSRGLNLLMGENGSGKTNTLETIHILTGWGPFRSLRKSSLVNWDCSNERTLLKGIFGGDESLEVLAGISSKTVLYCDGKRTTFSSLRERIPALAFLPDDLSLIDGSPSGRRRYLDRICALVFPLYARRLNDLKKTLRHRSIILKKGGDLSVTSRVLEPLVSWIWSVRSSVTDLVGIGLSSFPELLPGKLCLYHKRGGSLGIEDPYQDFWESLRASENNEKRYRSPMVGPHRDDLVITCGKKAASEVFSRGHRRRASVAMMLAAAWTVENRMKRKPVLMLDEIAAELDEKGRNIMVNTLAESSWQVFAATAEGNIRDWPGAVWAVEKGHVRKLD